MSQRFSLTIFLLSNVWLYLFFVHWLLDSLPAVLCQWKHPPQWMPNSSMALNSSQVSKSSASRSSLENTEGQHISWVQRGPWLGAAQRPDPAGSLWCWELLGLPPTTISFLNIHPVNLSPTSCNFSLFLDMVNSMPEISASILHLV